MVSHSTWLEAIWFKSPKAWHQLPTFSQALTAALYVMVSDSTWLEAIWAKKFSA